MSRLVDFTISAPFRYVWLKYVAGVDLEVHCARCLLGLYDSRIGPRAAGDFDLNQSDAQTLYLCGVSSPYRWSANVHVAWQVAEGEGFAFEENGISGRVENGRRLVIPRPVPRRALTHGEQRPYFTCRNWQFAVRYGPHLTTSDA